MYVALYTKLIEEHFKLSAKTLFHFQQEVLKGYVLHYKWIIKFTFVMNSEGLTVSYTLNDKNYVQQIKFKQSKVGYGTRAFVYCPHCCKPVNNLYFRYSWACRKCHGLYYTSSMEPRNEIAQIRLKILKVNQKLGIENSVYARPPSQKPLNMHRKTYLKLLNSWINLIRQFINALEASTKMFEALCKMYKSGIY